MRKFLITFLALVLIISCIPTAIAASEPTGIWACDSANVLSEETEAYINQMNQKFEDENRNARFAVIVATKTQPNQKSYMSSLFNEYGMSYDDDSYDVLVYIAIEDRKYDMEYGGAYDLEEAEFLSQDLKISMFGEDVRALLNCEDYDDAVMSIAKHFEKMMHNTDTDYYAQLLARKEKATVIFAIILSVLVVGVIAFNVIGYYIQSKKQKSTEATADNNTDSNSDSTKNEQTTT